MTLFARGRRDHVVQFYESHDDLAGRVAAYLLDAMRHGGAGLVVATPQHRAAIEDRLAQSGVDLAGARQDGSYLALDAAELMAQFMINGFADAASFWRAVSPVVKGALRGRSTLHVFGEMVALLWAEGQAAAAVDLEALWNELAGQYAFSLYCAYPAAVLAEDAQVTEVTEVIGAHSDLIRAGRPGEDVMSRA